MKIEILDLRLIDKDQPLKAFVDVKLDHITIREFRVIKENGKRLRVATPQISWKDTDGKIKYKTVITLPDELKGELDRVILNHFAEEMEKNNGQRTQR